MTFKRLWTGMLTAVVVGLCAPGAVRGTIWILGTAVVGPAVLDGPHVTIWQPPDTPFHEEFGGLSGLLIEGDILLAASDRGALFQASVERGTDGWLGTPHDVRMITLPKLQHLLDGAAKNDLEGLTRLLDGRLGLAFERHSRIDTLTDVDATPRATHRLDRFKAQYGNQAFEGIATLPDGRVLAILEGLSPARSTVGYLWDATVDGAEWSDGVDMPMSDGFVIVGADVGPDRCLYLLDRSFTWLGGFAHRLRRTSRLGDLGEVLHTSAPAVLGNAEGISMTALTNGDLIATLVTDDNFVPFTSTRLIEYRLTPGLACDGEF
jgi:hypothetical protein